MSYPATLNEQMSLLGGSPDARRLSAPHMQGLGQGLGHTQLGMSPSGGGRPLSLGGSPSHQFSAPGPPHFQASPGSQYAASPGSQYQTSSGTFGLPFCLLAGSYLLVILKGVCGVYSCTFSTGLS